MSSSSSSSSASSGSNAAAAAAPLALGRQTSDSQAREGSSAVAAYLALAAAPTPTSASIPAIIPVSSPSLSSSSTSGSSVAWPAGWPAPSADRLKSVIARFEDLHNADFLLSSDRRTLIKQGEIFRVTRFKNSPRHAFLFNDLLLIGKPSEKTKDKLVHKQTLDLRSVLVEDLSVKLGKKGATQFAVTAPGGESYVFNVNNIQEKVEWINKINEAITFQRMTAPVIANVQTTLQTLELEKKKADKLLASTLFTAIKERNESLMSFLLDERKDDPNHRDAEGYSALHRAILALKDCSIQEHDILLLMISQLLAANADLNACDPQGNTPLHIACALHAHAVAIQLISKGADAKKEDKNGKQPLWVLIVTPFPKSNNSSSLAATSPSPKSEERVVTKKSTPATTNNEKTEKTEKNDKTEKIEKRNEKNETNEEDDDEEEGEDDKEKEKEIEKEDEEEEEEEDSEETKRSKAKDAILNKTFEELVSAFMDGGADVDCRDNDGLSILSYAAKMNLASAVSILIEKGHASLASICKDGRTALHHAADAGAQLALHSLLAHGAAPNQRDHQACTPLHLARSLPIAVALLMSGARPDMKNTNGDKATSYFENIGGEEGKELMESVKSARDHFTQRSHTFTDGMLSTDKKEWVEDTVSEACLLCGDSFSLTRRRHHCRRCGILVCAPCSSKTFRSRSKPDEKLGRACDSCYNILQDKNKKVNAIKREMNERSREIQQIKEIAAKADAERKKKDEELTQRKKAAEDAYKAEKDRQAADRAAREKEEKELREKQSSNSPKREPPPLKGSKATKDANSTAELLKDTKGRLERRGEKLSQMEDKSQALADSAQSFASMATQLKNKMKNSTF